MILLRFMNCKQAYDTINNMRLFLSNPNYFNDPFDSRIFINEEDKDYIKAYKYASRPKIAVGGRCYGGSSDTKYVNKFTKIINDNLYSKDEYLNSKRIVCFSTQSDIYKLILLWSLYGDSHRGICIKFSEKFYNFINSEFLLKDIVYTNNIERINFSDMYDEDLFLLKRENALITKSKVWEYELEKRVIIDIDDFLNFWVSFS